MIQTQRHRTGATALAIIFTFAAGPVLAYSSGPPDGRTNAPGENNCTACHSTFPLNSGEGSLSLAGVANDTYTPGEVYTLQLTLADPDAMRWGFEFTILESGGTSVGDLASLGDDTQISSLGDRTYAKHTSAGTAPGTPTSHTWEVQWTAPAAGTGAVTLYTAGNGANNNGLNSGDRIYATSFVLAEGSSVGVDDLPLFARSLGNYPNPFNPRTTITFELDRAGAVRLTLFTPDGRRVKTLVDEYRHSGDYEIAWDGTDHAGRAMPSGIYLARLETNAGVAAHRLTLVR